MGTHHTQQGTTTQPSRSRVHDTHVIQVEGTMAAQSSAPGDRLRRPPERGHNLDERCDMDERNCRRPLPADAVLRALPTEYAGYTFRSRTEVRWAVFFDYTGIAWEYEREGFELDGERYLPDFWLPSIERWFEVKGTAPTYDEQRKAQWLADATGHDALIAFGEHICPNGAPANDNMLAFGRDLWDTNYWWCECPHCGHIDAQYEGRAARLRCRCIVARDITEDKAYAHDTDRLQGAYIAARRAFTGAAWRP